MWENWAGGQTSCRARIKRWMLWQWQVIHPSQTHRDPVDVKVKWVYSMLVSEARWRQGCGLLLQLTTRSIKSYGSSWQLTLRGRNAKCSIALISTEWNTSEEAFANGVHVLLAGLQPFSISVEAGHGVANLHAHRQLVRLAEMKPLPSYSVMPVGTDESCKATGGAVCQTQVSTCLLTEGCLFQLSWCSGVSVEL